MSYGANLKEKCFGRTAQDILKEKMPYFDPSKVKLIKDKGQKEVDPCEHLAYLLDLAQRNVRKKIKNSLNMLEFKIYLNQVDKDMLNEYQDHSGKL